MAGVEVGGSRSRGLGVSGAPGSRVGGSGAPGCRRRGRRGLPGVSVGGGGGSRGRRQGRRRHAEAPGAPGGRRRQRSPAAHASAQPRRHPGTPLTWGGGDAPGLACSRLCPGAHLPRATATTDCAPAAAPGLVRATQTRSREETLRTPANRGPRLEAGGSNADFHQSGARHLKPLGQ
ncbi:rRNA 2'-O-methyltransferase fibrillarin-like [Meles meles]|uniref:rRNA 2'-O-methyltransferase fibrillarin-like n=1 Tax=Meles meles TaxID=9662 RepID=UPI001E6999F8|nr:rRNA 2'-O-methyltransferase fibrillarin-like [Meles meles]